MIGVYMPENKLTKHLTNPKYEYVNKLVDHSREQPKGSLFNSNYSKK